jgi:excisionase family DNA binding protein
LQIVETVQVEHATASQSSSGLAPNRARLVTTLLQALASHAGKLHGQSALVPGASMQTDGAHFLSVRETAAILRVCRATIYNMIERGDLPHVRVRNAIRVVVPTPCKE